LLALPAVLALAGLLARRARRKDGWPGSGPPPAAQFD